MGTVVVIDRGKGDFNARAGSQQPRFLSPRFFFFLPFAVADY